MAAAVTRQAPQAGPPHLAHRAAQAAHRLEQQRHERVAAAGQACMGRLVRRGPGSARVQVIAPAVTRHQPAPRTRRRAHSCGAQASGWCTTSWRSRLMAFTASTHSAASRAGTTAATAAAESATGCTQPAGHRHTGQAAGRVVEVRPRANHPTHVLPAAAMRRLPHRAQHPQRLAGQAAAPAGPGWPHTRHPPPQARGRRAACRTAPPCPAAA